MRLQYLDIYNLEPLPDLIMGDAALERGLIILTRIVHKRLLLITGQRSLEASNGLGKLEAGLRRHALDWMHVCVSGEPNADLVDDFVSLARGKVDAVLAIGGGSVIDAAKATAAMCGAEGSVEDYLEGVGRKLHPGGGLPVVAVPTTAGTGSEGTRNAVISRPGMYKKSLRHPDFTPIVAVLDPELSSGSPVSLTAACGMDALTQLMESFLSTHANFASQALALEGLRYFRRGFEACLVNGQNLSARLDMAYAAFLSGVTLTSAGLGTVHGFASTLGAEINIPHGQLCALLLPEVIDAGWRKLAESGNVQALSLFESLADLLVGCEAGREALLSKLKEWRALACAGRKLRDFGLEDTRLSALCRATSNKFYPWQFTPEEMETLLRACF